MGYVNPMLAVDALKDAIGAATGRRLLHIGAGITLKQAGADFEAYRMNTPQSRRGGNGYALKDRVTTIPVEIILVARRTGPKAEAAIGERIAAIGAVVEAFHGWRGDLALVECEMATTPIGAGVDYSEYFTDQDIPTVTAGGCLVMMTVLS